MPTKAKAKKQSTVKKVAVKKPAAKRKMRSPLIPLLISVTTLFIFTLGMSSGVHLMQQTKPTSTSLLFVQQSVTGSMRPNGSGTYLLTMIGVKPHTLLFSDRPNRMVGSWTNTDFITRWDKTSNTAINGVLMSHSPIDGKEYSIPVQLTDPAFDGFGGWLSYTVKVLNEKNSTLAISSDRHTEAFPEILRSPALFIDAVEGPVKN